ncbi:MAG TPA: acyl-CoA dehydrogenase [Thermoanaerobaculia bacterium]|nr:acyl-CoA dehydrogenase [Thermoanaerobaculia bacterium]
MELDEREEYPEEEIRLLNDWTFHHYYVPRALGGKLESYEELLALTRVISRRDVTVAAAHGVTYLGASFVWTAGDDAQKRAVADWLLRQKQMAAGFHEEAHGSDLLAGQVVALPEADGYRLSGEKWAIGNAQHCHAMTVFARTDSRGGPRGFSLFLVDKEAVAGGWTCLPKILTHGIRGHEISGIRFENCRLAAGALLGSLGGGLELALKSSNITRTLAPALSLGAGDTALRATLDFALTRRLYGDSVFTLPHARRTLVRAFLDLLIGDCVTTAAARGLHVFPEQMSVASNVAKSFVPPLIEKMVHDLSIVLGARHYLREGHWHGIFQKILRDCVAARLMHFSSIISASQLGTQLHELVRYRSEANRAAETIASLEAVFSYASPLPPCETERFELFARGRDDVVQGLEIAQRLIAALAPRLEGERRTQEAALASIPLLLDEIARQREELDRLERESRPTIGSSAEVIRLSQRYAIVFAAAACLHTWLQNRDQTADEFLRAGLWLRLSLSRLIDRLERRTGVADDQGQDKVAQEMVRRHRDGQSFGIVPIELAGTDVGRVSEPSGFP